MDRQQTTVVVGGGLAGASAVQALRDGGFDGRVVLVADEDELPYERPPLSKGFLTGDAERDSIYLHSADWYRDQHIDLLCGRSATELLPERRELVLDGGERLVYDRLLLATGAAPRRFSGPGAELSGIHHLRTAADSAALRRDLESGIREVVIVGAGWIGLEVASAARHYGNRVTVLGRETVPLGGILGDEAGEVFGDLHRENGVDLRMSVAVRGLRGNSSGVTGVVLETGELIPADVVVVGIGAIPNVGLAKAAGLAVDNGILVDAAFRTSDPAVYAVGDVANVYHPVLGDHLRIEHWANALNAGAAAGRSMLGEEVVYDEIPYFYSDQFDLGMEYSGYGPLTAGAHVIFRGEPSSRKFIAFWLSGSRVVAGMNVNVWDVNELVQRLIRSRARIDAGQLADESQPLESVLDGVEA